VLSLSHMVHLLSNEFACRGGRSPSLFKVLFCRLFDLFFRHRRPSIQKVGTSRRLRQASFLSAIRAPAGHDLKGHGQHASACRVLADQLFVPLDLLSCDTTSQQRLALRRAPRKRKVRFNETLGVDTPSA